jgi:hypothetical protein
MVKAANLSTVSVRDMSEAMKYVGPLASAAGLSLEKTASMIALLGESGIKGSQGGTAMREILAALIHPLKTAKKAMAELGVSTKDLHKGLDNIPAFFASLEKKMNSRKMDRAKQLEMIRMMFGVESISAVEAILKSMHTPNTQGQGTIFDKYATGVVDASGEMAKNAAKLGDTMEGRLKKLKAAAESAAIEIGGKLAPRITELIPKITEAAIKTGDWVTAHSDLVADLAVGIPSVVAMTYAANGLASAFGAILKFSAWTGINVTGASAGAAFGTSFIGAALPVIAAGIAGFGIGSLIAKAIDAEGLGAKLYAALHPGDRDTSPSYSPADMIRKSRAAQAQAAAGEAAKPPPALRPDYSGFAGQLDINIQADGAMRSKLTTRGPLRVGVNVPP